MRPHRTSSGGLWRVRPAFTILAAAVVLIATLRLADAQRTTEQFIPIGQSPGLSGVVTYLGEIVAVDTATRSLTLRGTGASGQVTVAIAGDTRIWLDRSSVDRPNVSGTMNDMTVGSVAEIHFKDQDRRQTAAWVKVQLESRR